jgi:hypothetical protein
VTKFVVYEMKAREFSEFREHAIASLLEAALYEYLYIGASCEEADELRVSLRRALERWWDRTHKRVEFRKHPTFRKHSTLIPGWVLKLF